MGNERRSLSLIRDGDGKVVAVAMTNYFRTRPASLERAKDMVNYPEGIHRIVGPEGTLIVGEEYLRGVRELKNPDARRGHIEYISTKLKQASQVIFQPNPYKTVAVRSSGS